MPPRPSSSMISYSAARASRTRSVSWSAPVAMACTGVVAMRSRPQEGQNLDFPVISLPHREQNMRASYPPHGGSQAEIAWRIARAVADGTSVGASPLQRYPHAQWHEACSASRRRLYPDRAPTSEPDRPTGDTVVPYHTIAFSQQKLRAALRRAAGQDPAFTYGFVVHSRRYSDHPTLGLITLHGESLPLNERLLQALDGAPLWLFGHARITLGSGIALAAAEHSKADPLDRPLASLLMHIATFDTSTGITQHLVQVEAQVKAETLVQPLLVLTHARPNAWPL